MSFSTICFALTLICLVSSQGGGGSSSSGGSSSDSNDKNDGFSQTKSCTEKCQGQENVSQCEADCSDDNHKTQIIVGCIIGPLAGLGLIFYVYKKRVSLKNRFFGSKVKKDLKSEFLKSIGTCDDPQKITNSLQAINNNAWDCTFWVGGTSYHINDFRFYGIQTSENGDIDLIVSGEDKFGKWDGNGVVACDNTNLIHIWFLKNYQNKKAAGQTGDWTTLIYQGTLDMQYSSFDGHWWYHGFSKDAKYSYFSLHITQFILFDQMQANTQIQLLPLTCNKTNHQGKSIEALCLRKECNYSSAQCCLCIFEFHKECVSQSKIFKEIPQLMQPLLQIYQDMIIFQEKIDQLMKDLISSLESILTPINQYLDHQNLSNFNELGLFLKYSGKVENEIRMKLKKCAQKINFRESSEVLNQKLSQEEQQKQDIQIDPNQPCAWFNKGNALKRLNRFQEAISCYDRAIQIEPNQPGAWANKGNALKRLNRLQEAIDCYDRAILIEPNQIYTQFNKGAALQNLNKFNEAIDCYDRAILIDPNFPSAYYSKGNALQEQNKFEEAIDCYNKVIQIDPNDIMAKKKLEQIKLAMME